MVEENYGEQVTCFYQEKNLNLVIAYDSLNLISDESASYDPEATQEKAELVRKAICRTLY